MAPRAPAQKWHYLSEAAAFQLKNAHTHTHSLTHSSAPLWLRLKTLANSRFVFYNKITFKKVHLYLHLRPNCCFHFGFFFGVETSKVVIFFSLSEIFTATVTLVFQLCTFRKPLQRCIFRNSLFKFFAHTHAYTCFDTPLKFLLADCSCTSNSLLLLGIARVSGCNFLLFFLLFYFYS